MLMVKDASLFFIGHIKAVLYHSRLAGAPSATLVVGAIDRNGYKSDFSGYGSSFGCCRSLA